MDKSLLSMYDLTDKTAIITGASRGLGFSFAQGLAKAGCNLVITSRNLRDLKHSAEKLLSYGHRVYPLKSDVTSISEIEKMVDDAIDTFGKIDILVNNAGISAINNAEDMAEKEWQSVIDTNLTGVFNCAQRVGRYMIKQGYGKIINIASLYGIVGSSYVAQASYVASKSAVLGLTRELAVEWAPRGLHVIALAPGFFPSDLLLWTFEKDKDFEKKILSKIPMGRIGKLDELEGTIVYLASSASNYMNGQALICDGGFLSW